MSLRYGVIVVAADASDSGSVTPRLSALSGTVQDALPSSPTVNSVWPEPGGSQSSAP